MTISWGNIKFEDYELKPHHKKLADKVQKVFDGLDIFSLDVVKTKDGREVILELNDTATGFMYDHEKEDLNIVKSIVLEKMNSLFTK